jgi:hypothetical protein
MVMGDASSPLEIIMDMEVVFSWLGLSQYLERLIQAGFDSWDMVMEITEEDLEALNIELGHRRKLQKEIAKSRKLAERSHHNHDYFPSPMRRGQESVGDGQWHDNPPAMPQRKRGYVHHPKPDPNAPERPYSAYVVFAKAVRDELKSQPLSFTDIAKEVGERWQHLTPEEKQSWKRQAAIPREKYKVSLAKYQQSESHWHYLQYLAEFRSAQAAKRGNAAPHKIGQLRKNVPSHGQ